MALVSIIIPVYKVPFEFLDQCIGSIINQTYKDIEIIIIDDGSPKEWADKCDEYAKSDSRIKVLHKTNGGVSEARNIGINVATSHWITFVDGDDWIDEDFIESFVHYKETIKDSELIDIYIFSGYRNYDNNDRICKPHFPSLTFFKTNDEKEKLQTLCFINYTWKSGNKDGLLISSAWGKIYRKDFLKKNNLYFILTPYAEDCLYFLDTVEKSQTIVYINKPVYHYRYNPDSAVNIFRPNAIMEHNAYLSYIFDFAKKHNKSRSFVEKANYRVFTSIYTLIKQYLFNKKNKLSIIKKWQLSFQLFNKEPYKTSLKEIKPNIMRRNSQIKYYLIKFKLYPLLELGRRGNFKMNKKS